MFDYKRVLFRLCDLQLLDKLHHTSARAPSAPVAAPTLATLRFRPRRGKRFPGAEVLRALETELRASPRRCKCRKMRLKKQFEAFVFGMTWLGGGGGGWRVEGWRGRIRLTALSHGISRLSSQDSRTEVFSRISGWVPVARLCCCGLGPGVLLLPTSRFVAFQSKGKIQNLAEPEDRRPRRGTWLL